MELGFITALTTLCVCLAVAYWMLSGLVDKLDNENADLRQRIDALERRNDILVSPYHPHVHAGERRTSHGPP